MLSVCTRFKFYDVRSTFTVKIRRSKSRLLSLRLGTNFDPKRWETLKAMSICQSLVFPTVTDMYAEILQSTKDLVHSLKGS